MAAVTLTLAACGGEGVNPPENPDNGNNNNEPASVNNKFASKPFSIGDNKVVYFSQGNLQYRASTNTWQFAQNQYDTIGAANANISSTYNGWIDLFGWGTSGFNDKYPYMTSTTPADYGDGVNNIAGTNYDWGVYNAINNGGNSKGQWRTLTKDEWVYLFDTRTNASQLRGQATVNGVHGYILLPDNSKIPEVIPFTASPNDWTTNTYDAVTWGIMESNGAVFLPAAGYRAGMNVQGVGSYGYYWSSASYYNAEQACVVNIQQGSANPYFWNNRDRGRAVRLVQDVQ